VRLSALQSDILRFIVESGYKPGDLLPTIQELSRELGASVPKVRESMELARALGLVEVKPGRGTMVNDYTFVPAATLSALYAIGQDWESFEHLRIFRTAIEVSFWEEAARQLTPDDCADLRRLITVALDRLGRQPIQVPVIEHRTYHLTIFKHLENPFVLGTLEAFWEAYEAFGLHLYADLDYHRKVWKYHRQIVDAIERGDIEESRQLFVEHTGLIRHREQSPPPPTRRRNFFDFE
jgi:DNA-binding FadR family transcriptional regulator